MGLFVNGYNLPMLYILTGQIQIGKTRWLTSQIARGRAAGVHFEGIISPGRWRTRDDGSFEKLGIDLRFLGGLDSANDTLIDFATRKDLLFAEGEGARASAGVGASAHADTVAGAGAHDDLQKDTSMNNCADANNTIESRSQSSAAGLGWAMRDTAIDEANAYFRHLKSLAEADAKLARTASSVESNIDTNTLLNKETRIATAATFPANTFDNTSTDSSSSPRRILIVDEFGRLELMRNAGFVDGLALLDMGPTPRYSDAVIIVREDLVLLALERFEASWPKIEIIHPSDSLSQSALH
jgi:hypothetical protein